MQFNTIQAHKTVRLHQTIVRQLNYYDSDERVYKNIIRYMTHAAVL